MASSSRVPLSWKRKPDRAFFTPPKARSRSAAECWRRRRHNRRHENRFRNCRSVRRKCRRTTSMPHRFYHLSFVITWLSVAGLACALPSQKNRPSTIVVIDAGHGGFDPGGDPPPPHSAKKHNVRVAAPPKTKIPADGHSRGLTTDYGDKLAEEIPRGILGKPALVARAPASHYYPPATEAEAQPFNSYAGTDFIKAPPEPSTAQHRKRSKGAGSKKSSHHRTAQKSSGSATVKKAMPENVEK